MLPSQSSALLNNRKGFESFWIEQFCWISPL
jgi:hypothetical protein